VIDSTIQNPSYTYTTAGIYTVSLTVSYGSLGTSTETKKDYIKVGDAGAGVPGGQATIGAAIAAAPPGGIVLVGAGTYHEDITIDKAGLSLLAASRPVIDGNVLVSASGVTIKGFDITGYVGVTTAGTDVTVLDCTYKARQLTADAHHDRNSSVFKASDGTLWVFFAKGRTLPAPPDPDDECCWPTKGYDIAYLKSTDGGASYTEGALPAIPNDKGGTAQGAIWPAAFQDPTGKIWVFYVADGDEVYYFTSTNGGTTWTGPTATGIKTLAPSPYHHMDAAFWNGKIWVVIATTIGGTNAVYAFSSTDASTWTGPTQISQAGLSGVATPRIMLDGSTIRVAYFGPTGVYIASSTDGTTWTNTFVVASGVTDFDPALVKLSGTYHLFWAPGESSTEPHHYHQWIERTTSTNLTTWSTPVQVTTGCNADCSKVWWDYWAEPFVDGGNLYLFHSSLRNSSGTNWTDSNLWLIMNP
jgi:PKD repeat protein